MSRESASSDPCVEPFLAPELTRIRRDLQAVPEPLRSLLQHIHDHLTEPDLSVESAVSACGVPRQTAYRHCRQHLGTSPSRYITERRHEVAKRLLAWTSVPIWQISRLLGFHAHQSFYRSFERHVGVLPADYRRQAHDAYETLGERDEESRDVAWLRAALVGEASDEQARHVIDRLIQVYVARRRG